MGVPRPFASDYFGDRKYRLRHAKSAAPNDRKRRGRPTDPQRLFRSGCPFRGETVPWRPQKVRATRLASTANLGLFCVTVRGKDWSGRNKRRVDGSSRGEEEDFRCLKCSPRSAPHNCPASAKHRLDASLSFQIERDGQWDGWTEADKKPTFVFETKAEDHAPRMRPRSEKSGQNSKERKSNRDETSVFR